MILDGGGTPRTLSAHGNRFTFTGRELDHESGLYYFRARYYDGRMGRFAGRDPIGYVEGNNLYAAYFAPQRQDASGLAHVTIDADAFIPWAWVSIPPDPRAIGIARGLGAQDLRTQSFVMGDDRPLSPVPLRSQVRIANWITIETCNCKKSSKVDPTLTNHHTIGLSERKDIFYWDFPFLAPFSRARFTRAEGELQSLEKATSIEHGSGCLSIVDLRASGGVPLEVALLPLTIDYQYRVYVLHKGNTITWSVNAAHDGFPGHEFYIRYGGKSVYAYGFVPPGTGWIDSPARLAGMRGATRVRSKGSFTVSDRCCR